MRGPERWEPHRGRRFSRRRLLGGAGALAALGGLSMVGCGELNDRRTTPVAGDDDDENGIPIPGTNGTNGNDAPSTPSNGDLSAPSLTVTGFVFSDGQFDPHKTQIGALHGQQAFVYSRLLTFASQATGELTPDLAEELPEQPEEDTFVFRLRPGARWHDSSPLNGRQVTAEDVRFSFERQMEGDESFARRGRWNFIESIEAPNDREFIVRTRAPFAGSLSRFGETGAFIVPPEHEAADAGFGTSRQIGSGPFTWIEWDERNFASVARNANWHGDAPPLSGVTIVEPKDSATVEAMLRVRELDVAFMGARQAERLSEAMPQLRRQEVGNALFFGMRFYTPARPYNDPRFRTALSIALDRTGLVDSLFQGAGGANGWVSWPVTQWALSHAELSEIPGYRLGSGARAQDISEARAMLESMRSDDLTVPNSLTLHAEASSEEQLSLGSYIARQLWESLEIDVRLEYVPIDELVERHFRGDAPWITGPDTGWLDLDDWVYPYFHSAGQQNSFALRDDDLDALIEQQRTEFDAETRQGLGRNIQRRVLEINAGVNLVSERVVALSWPYVRDFPLDISDGYQDRFARCWVDTEDATYRRR